MAGVARHLTGRALCAWLCLVLAAPALSPGPAAAQTAGGAWYRPIVTDGRSFPVLLSARRRWLNWRDTYGAPRMRFEGGVWKQTGVHQGIDIFAENGAPVVSISSGVVENAGWTFYSGRRVGIRDGSGRYWFYAHLSATSPSIVKGATVKPGDYLGLLGSSGYGPEPTDDEFPPHLHFGLQNGSRWENPEPMLRRLYQAAVLSVREARRESIELRRRIALAESRSSSPGAPDAAALQRLAATLKSGIDAAEGSLTFHGYR